MKVVIPNAKKDSNLSKILTHDLVQLSTQMETTMFETRRNLKEFVL